MKKADLDPLSLLSRGLSVDPARPVRSRRGKRKLEKVKHFGREGLRASKAPAAPAPTGLVVRLVTTGFQPEWNREEADLKRGHFKKPVAALGGACSRWGVFDGERLVSVHKRRKVALRAAR